MPERRVKVASKVGLHARPAAMLAKAAQEQSIPIMIRKLDGLPVDAASILSLMTLGAAHGDEVVLSAEGESAETVLEKLAELISAEHE